MAFWGDYHTHTTYSHGKGTIEDNVLRALELGLKEIAITDHGFKHLTFNVRRMDWPYMERDVKRIRQKYPDINIYLGLETNFNSPDGNIDVLPSEINVMDIVVCGYHSACKPDRVRDFYRYFVPNLLIGCLLKTTTKKMYVRNTDAYLKALERYEIDIVSHPNHPILIDSVEVAKACKHFGTYFELNGKRNMVTDAEMYKVVETGVEFICNSDAHRAENVGNFAKGIEVIERVGIPLTQVANWERLPKLRSRILKEKLAKNEFIL